MAEEKKVYFKSSGHLPEMGKSSLVNLDMPKGHRKGRRRRWYAPPPGRERCGYKGEGSPSRRVKAAWRVSGTTLPLRAWARANTADARVREWLGNK